LTSKCDFDLGVRGAGVVHDIIPICAKYFQNPFKYVEVIDQTQNIPYNRLCQSLTLKCALRGRDPCFAPDISSYTICAKYF
jgi:hypothetical protein